MPEVFRCLLLLLYVLLIHDLDLDAFKQGLALSEILSDPTAADGDKQQCPEGYYDELIWFY